LPVAALAELLLRWLFCWPQVELLEHFYDALCGLVERQRLSDPLSLYVVHQVRTLIACFAKRLIYHCHDLSVSLSA
jgi:hypothetical protein